MSSDRLNIANINSDFRTGRAVLHGTIGGICGGILFGLLLTLNGPDSVPSIGSLIGAPGFATGWLYHLFISATIGSMFGLVLSRVVTTYRFGALWGIAYGLIWWVLGGLTLFPLMMGMFDQVLVVDSGSIPSLLGHIIYGATTGLLTVFLNKRSAPTRFRE